MSNNDLINELEAKARGVQPKVVPCVMSCHSGHRGMDNCNTCGITGSQFIFNGKRFPNTELGYIDSLREIVEQERVMNKIITVHISQEGDKLVAECFPFDVVTQADSIPELFSRLGKQFAAEIELAGELNKIPQRIMWSGADSNE